MFAALERGMLSLDGEQHDRLRALVHQAFTPRRIELMRGQAQVLADDLLDTAEHRGREMDLMRLAIAPEQLRWRGGIILRGLDALPVTLT
jgi:cytochrome P450